MRNSKFMFIPEDQKRRKFMAMVQAKTGGCISIDDMKRIMNEISLNKQYSIRVYHDLTAIQSILENPTAYRKCIIGHQSEICKKQILVYALKDNNKNQLAIYIPHFYSEEGE